MYFSLQHHFLALFCRRFLADRTNGRTYAAVLHPLSVVCDVVYCG